MRYVTCPSCEADLNPRLLRDRSESRCPFCGDDVGDLLAAIEEQTEFHGNAAFRLDALPPESGISCAESSDDRVVLILPPGGKNVRGMGCFGAMWSAFIGVFTAVFIGTGGLADGPIIMIPLLGVFWFVGLFMLGSWFRMSFTRTFLLVERERIAVQRHLLAFKQTQALDLTETSSASLIESYSVNDVPVNRVEVSGAGDAKLKLATRLSEPEKRWLCNSLNEFLGNEPTTVSQTPQVISSLMSPTSTTQRTATKPSQLEIEQDDFEQLQFSLPPFSRSLPKPVLWFVRIFGMVWCGFCLVFAGNLLAIGGWQFGWNFATLVQAIVLLFQLPFMIFGAILVALPNIADRGRVTIRLDSERLQARYHIGVFGFSKRRKLANIDDIVAASAPFRRESGASENVGYTVGVTGASKVPLYLALLESEESSRYVVELMKRWMDEHGVQIGHG